MQSFIHEKILPSFYHNSSQLGDYCRTITSSIVRNINNKLLINKALVTTIHCTQTIKDYTASYLLQLTACGRVDLDIL